MYLDLHSRENSVSQEALDTIKDFPILEVLEAELILEELNKAIDVLSCGKAPGEDGIPSEIIKCDKLALFKPLNELLCLCWGKGNIPQDMHNFKLVTLYKNKGDCAQ